MNIQTISPCFLERTCFARVIDFPSKTFNFTTNMIFIEELCKYAVIMSKREEVPLLTAKQVLEKLRSVEVYSVEKLSFSKVDRETLETLLKEKNIDKNVIVKFLSRNWRQVFKTGVFF